jgi:hypothetical protein
MANGRGIGHADFIGIERRVADSAAFTSLPPIARALYLDLRRQFNGRNNGQISAVLIGSDSAPGLCGYGWPARTVFKYLTILVEHGLIEKTRQGGIAAMSKTCTLYAFTDIPTAACMAKGIAGAMASRAYASFVPKEPAPRKRKEDAQHAAIDAPGAHTQLHAVPSASPTTAPRASNAFRSNVDQPHDETAVSIDSTSETGNSPHMHAVHTLITLPTEGAVMSDVEGPLQRVHLAGDSGEVAAGAAAGDGECLTDLNASAQISLPPPAISPDTLCFLQGWAIMLRNRGASRKSGALRDDPDTGKGARCGEPEKINCGPVKRSAVGAVAANSEKAAFERGV